MSPSVAFSILFLGVMTRATFCLFYYESYHEVMCFRMVISKVLRVFQDVFIQYFFGDMSLKVPKEYLFEMTKRDILLYSDGLLGCVALDGPGIFCRDVGIMILSVFGCQGLLGYHEASDTSGVSVAM